MNRPTACAGVRSLAGIVSCLLVVLMSAAGAWAQNTVTVNTATRFQTIEGWGTSVAGWTGTNYQDPNFRAAYRAAGFNILRVDMGQRVVDPECGGTPVTFTGNVASDAALLNFNHSRVVPYWQTAQWLAANALEPERVKIEGSVWTPPHWMKGSNGCSTQGAPNPKCSTFGGDSIGGRLVQDNDATLQANRTQFARYFAAWLYKWKQVAGVPISFASIQNELSYENPFDSCSYQKAPGCVDAYWQWARALRAAYDQLSANGQLGETQLMGPHEAGIGEVDSNPYQLLFSSLYLQSLQDIDPTLYNALPIVNNNGYVGESAAAARCWDAQIRGIDNVPGAWPAWSFPPIMHTGIGTGKKFWASEADGVAPANAMAYSVRMHNALVHGRVSGYVSWQMSDGGASETEHTLLGNDNWATPHNSLKYCNFKHFSRYIRPGAQRVAATFSNGEATVLGADRWDANSGLSVSAWVHDADNRTTVVLINRTGSSQPVNFNGLPDGSYAVYQTKGTDTTGFNQLSNVAVSGGAGSITVPAGSVTTLTAGTSGGGGDPQPPAAPTGLAAVPGDQQVVLSWTASSGATSYNVKRSTTSGSGYSTIASPTTTSHTDTALTNGTTYYYVVSAVNSVGESANSSQASATPQAAPTAISMHVSSIVVTTVSVGGGNKRGQAQVTVLDDLGNPVSGATVSGTFSGSISGSNSAVTNSSGVATVQSTNTAKGKVSITFCVDNVTHASLTYNSAANVETCDSGS